MDAEITTREARKMLSKDGRRPMKRHAFDDAVEALGLEPVRRIGVCRMWRVEDVEKIRAAEGAVYQQRIERAFGA